MRPKVQSLGFPCAELKPALGHARRPRAQQATHREGPKLPPSSAVWNPGHGSGHTWNSFSARSRPSPRAIVRGPHRASGIPSSLAFSVRRHPTAPRYNTIVCVPAPSVGQMIATIRKDARTFFPAHARLCGRYLTQHPHDLNGLHHCARIHLAHRVSAIDLHRDLGNSHCRSNRLIHRSGRHVS